MKNVLIFIGISLLIFACNPQTSETDNTALIESPEEIRDGVFIHLSHGPEDPHRVLMALRMAEIMSEDKDVLVYFDIKAVHVVLKDSENITMEGSFPNSNEQLANLMKKGVKLQVCPGCLNAAGKKPEDVMEGVNLANKDSFFSFTKGRILTLDY